VPAGGKYGKRQDGTEKGEGFFGELKRPGGGFSTELSIGVNLDGKEIEIPALVPTLTEQEKNFLLEGNKPTQEIVNKAVKHARERMKRGESPFAGKNDRQAKQKQASGGYEKTATNPKTGERVGYRNGKWEPIK
jgi:hypothetical protein